MHVLTQLIKEDMKPALGVTEPGAIAFAAAAARARVKGEVEHVSLRLNSGMFKNAFTCGIPGSDQVGNYYAAALGVVAADPGKGLECLEGITGEEERKAREMVENGQISVELSEISSRIFIEVKVTGRSGDGSAGAGAAEVTGTTEAAEATERAEITEATVTIRDSHMNIVEITENGKVIYSKKPENSGDGESLGSQGNQKDQANLNRPDGCLIHRYTLKQLYEYASAVPAEEIAFIEKAYDMNGKLFEAGIRSPKTTYGPYLLKKNGGKVISENERLTASLLCNGAIEARVIGLSRPAMSITGSGAHGIIATMPLYGACRVNGYTKEALLRATALSYLVCMYIKEYSGRLSAFCGCAIAAGTGMACGLVYLRGGSPEIMEKTINNMASSITGMICDGGNQGCTMKGIVAVDAAYESVELAMNGVYISSVHGINGATPEETMRNMGRIASPGMVGTEKTIIEILEEKR